MENDAALLLRYARDGAEDAFAEIVRRHINFIYQTALRQVGGDAHHASDVTQYVFTEVARQAASLADHRVLKGWLFTTACHAAANIVRAERRRHRREQEAHAMQNLVSEPEPPADWAEVCPLINDALTALSSRDREAVLLRYFEGHDYVEIGTRFSLTADAARLRVDRALEKMRVVLSRAGVTSSTAALASTLAAQAGIVAPAGLAASVTTAALTGTAAIATTTATKLGIITFMTTTKSIAWFAGAVAIFALGYSGYQYREAATRGQENVRLTQERNQLEAALNQSEQRSAKLSQRATDAEQHMAELQHKLDGLLAPKSVRATKIGPVPASETRTLVAEKMAQMKPLLEGGMPIKGAVVVLVDGKPVQRPVEFVIGNETRIDAADDGTYIVTPTLNQDGSVKYAMALLRKDAASGQETIEKLPAVVQTPWGGFILGSSGGKVMAFDPDKSEP